MAKKTLSKQTVVIIHTVMVLVCLVILGVGFIGAIASGDWLDWSGFIMLGGLPLIASLLFLLDDFGVLSRFIY